MRMRLFVALWLVAVSGCTPLDAVNDIYSADTPGKTSARTRNHVSNGDPESLKDREREVGSADWRDLPPAE